MAHLPWRDLATPDHMLARLQTGLPGGEQEVRGHGIHSVCVLVLIWCCLHRFMRSLGRSDDAHAVLCGAATGCGARAGRVPAGASPWPAPPGEGSVRRTPPA